MADYYVDPSKTNGTGSIGSPYNSITAALTAATGSNDRILLARGYVYQKFNNFYAARIIKTPSVGLYIGAYTASDSPNTMNPTFNAITFEPPGTSGWSLVQAGTGVWKKAYASAGSNVTVWRVFTGARLTGPAANNAQGTGYILGTARARTPVAYNATEATVMANINSAGSVSNRLWAHINQPSGFLYIYTGSDTLDPPTFYNGLGIVGSDGAGNWGCYNGVVIQDSQRITMEDVDCIGAVDGNHNINASGNAGDCTDITLIDCNSYGHALSGISLAGLAATTPQFVRRVLIKNSTFDSIATLNEDWNFRVGTGISWLNGGQDDISVQQRCNGIEFLNCTVKDGYHSCIKVETFGVAAIDNIVFRDCKLTAYNRLYGHGIVTAGVTSVCLFDRCTIAGMTQYFQIMGGATQMRNCLCYDPMAPYGAYNGTNNVNSEPACSIGTVSAIYPTMSAGLVVIDNCTFVESYGYMWQIYSRVSGSLADNFAAVRNCTFLDSKYLNAQGRAVSTTFGPDPGKSILFSLAASEPTPVFTFENNNYYTGTANQNIVVYQQSSVVTYSTLSAMPGASGNTESNPKLNLDFRPGTGSPLIGAGTFLRNDNDVDGLARKNPPTIGAYEVF